ncbi:hypothetical protein BGZ60DRAFT_535397 [Tricladium varicosporioides]|nr:hypothetical protein BGZ60DRAFT_535397 [Hymenoscyphus varicosporioides]
MKFTIVPLYDKTAPPPVIYRGKPFLISWTENNGPVNVTEWPATAVGGGINPLAQSVIGNNYSWVPDEHFPLGSFKLSIVDQAGAGEWQWTDPYILSEATSLLPVTSTQSTQPILQANTPTPYVSSTTGSLQLLSQTEIPSLPSSSSTISGLSPQGGASSVVTSLLGASSINTSPSSKNTTPSQPANKTTIAIVTSISILFLILAILAFWRYRRRASKRLTTQIPSIEKSEPEPRDLDCKHIEIGGSVQVLNRDVVELYGNVVPAELDGLSAMSSSTTAYSGGTKGSDVR